MISHARLDELLDRFSTLTVSVVGDLFLDRYLDIAPGVQEDSVETGLEAYQIPSVRNYPGAAGTVMNNLATIGVELIRPVTVIGDDGHGYDLMQQLTKLPVDAAHVLASPDRLTPTYTKPLRQNNHGNWEELNRLDVRSREPLSEPLSEALQQHIEQAFHDSNGMIILDQINEENWGVINDPIRSFLSNLARQNPEKLIFVDSRSQLHRFHFGTLKGNRSEIIAAAGIEDTGTTAAAQAAQHLSAKTKKTVFCTLGPDGTLTAQPDHPAQLSPGFQVSGPVDICGAGDSASCGIVCSLLAGAYPLEAALVGNLVASITVQQLGTTGTASPEQIRMRWQEISEN